MNNFKKRVHGFTLIELLVVIVILGVLIGYVAPNYFGQLDKSKNSAARTQIHAFENALDRYRVDIGNYPTTQDGLEALIKNRTNDPNWAGPYLRKEIPLDPWGIPYQYKRQGLNEVIILSLGSDGISGNDDIQNTK